MVPWACAAVRFACCIAKQKIVLSLHTEMMHNFNIKPSTLYVSDMDGTLLSMPQKQQSDESDV
jgi:hypothetical protein